MPRAALFDMDRTLLRVESASAYVRYQRAHGDAGWRDSLRVAYWVAQYTLGVVDAPKVAAAALESVRGLSDVALAARCDECFAMYLERHLTDGGRRAVERHRAEGRLLAVVTAASTYGAWPTARALGIAHVVATELEAVGHVLTGRALDPLCYGEGKVVRAEAFARRHGFTLRDAVVYTDSATDLPLLEAAGEAVAVNPDSRLARAARRRGWRVERW